MRRRAWLLSDIALQRTSHLPVSRKVSADINFEWSWLLKLGCVRPVDMKTRLLANPSFAGVTMSSSVCGSKSDPFDKDVLLYGAHIINAHGKIDTPKNVLFCFGATLLFLLSTDFTVFMNSFLTATSVPRPREFEPGSVWWDRIG